MEERRARNEALFREVNERIESISRELTDRERALQRLQFVCECGREDCTDVLDATIAEYEAVRANARRFLVLPGHDQTETARVVERTSRFFVVEKLGIAGEVAIERDPRA